MSTFYSYCLQSDDGKRTYIGATVNPDRRLQQHQGLMAGGAKATAGRTWRRVCLVGGFPTWNDALKFEWRWKQIKRRNGHNWSKALEILLALEKPTESATPYKDYSSGGPVVELS